MALPNNTAVILRFMGYDDFAYDARFADGIVILSQWDDVLAGGPQPTDQEIIDAGNDLTTVNGQVFSEWYAEHGGDPILTLRREAQEALDKQNSRIEALIRALALVTMDEINIIRADPDINLPARTAEQLRTAIKTKIADGEADT
jgi:hypothetical protein